MTKLDKMGIKQLQLEFTFIIWCLFSFLIKCSETSLGAVVILPLVMIGQWELTFSGLKQVLHYQTGQNGYQTVPFSVYVHNLMFVFLFDQVFWNSLGAVVILPLDRPAHKPCRYYQMSLLPTDFNIAIYNLPVCMLSQENLYINHCYKWLILCL